MKKTSTVIAVASGKGGVGKSVLSVNLAETLARAGLAAALIDADAGQGACPILLNETPLHSVFDIARGTAFVSDVLHTTASGLTLVQSASDPMAATGQDALLTAGLDAVLDHLRERHEYIIIDAPAGVDGSVRWALDRADVGLLVLVGEPTAIADAYRLSKLIWQSDPEYPLAAVVNFADSAEDAAGVAERFGRLTTHFTGRSAQYLGWVPFSAEVRRSVSTQMPVVNAEEALRSTFDVLVRNLVGVGKSHVIARP